MKNKIKIVCLALAGVLSIFGVACNANTNSSSATTNTIEWREKNMNCSISANTYSDIPSLTSKEQITAYNNDTKTPLPCENGVIKSPYYELRINGRKVPVYASRTTNGIHSFAYIDVEKEIKDQPFALNTELSFLELSTVRNEYGEDMKIDVLPESKGVKAVCVRIR